MGVGAPSEKLMTPDALQEEFSGEVPESYRDVIRLTTFEGSEDTLYSNHIRGLCLAGYPEIQPFTPHPGFAEEIAERGLSPEGQMIVDAISGANVVDFGCGDPSMSWIPRVLAENGGASRYIGIDQHVKPIWRGLRSLSWEFKRSDGDGYDYHRLCQHKTGRSFVSNGQGIPMGWMEGDSLAYISKASGLGKSVFFICGMDAGYVEESPRGLPSDPETGENYYDLLIKEISRISSEDSMIVVSGSCGSLVRALEAGGWVDLRNCVPGFTSEAAIVDLWVKSGDIDAYRRSFAERVGVGGAMN